MSPPEDKPVRPVRCTACAERGRDSWLTDPLSRALEMGPTCARRKVVGDPTAAAEMQLVLDLGTLPTQPRKRHRELVGA